MPLAQDRSLDLLVSSPERYHCTTDAPEQNHHLGEDVKLLIGPNIY